MENDLRIFPEQLRWKPEVVHQKRLRPAQQIIVIGMGGSHLAADVYRMLRPRVHMHVHQSYGLPYISDLKKDETLIVLSSYSGNTTEVLDAYSKARKANISVAVMSSGGALLQRAIEDEIPHIILPEVSQPRVSIGYGVVALAHILRDKELMDELYECAPHLSGTYSEDARTYASWLEDHIPLVYASHTDFALAYIWKIALNETAKIPAFANSFPELNHNEMEGFDVEPDKEKYQKRFRCLMLVPLDADNRIQERMEITAEIFNRRGIETRLFERAGETRTCRAFRTLLFSEWVAYELARMRGIDPESVPLIERFKKRLSH